MPDTEMIFPLRVIHTLRDLRSGEWPKFIDALTQKTAEPVDQFAFVLLMVRLGGCLGCNADAFRAMKGCAQCARQTIRRYRGSDTDFFRQYNNVRAEVQKYLEKRHVPKEKNG